jgi:spore coat protein H
VTDQWPLIRYLLDDPAYREAYRGYVAKAAESEYEPAWATARFQDAHTLIAPYVIGPEGELPGYTFVTSEAAFEGTLTELQGHVSQRQADVAAYLQP